MLFEDTRLYRIILQRENVMLNEFVYEAIWYSVFLNKIELVKNFLKHINANITNVDGTTLLMIAVERNLYTMTKILLDNGADPFLKDKYGNSVFTYIVLCPCDKNIENLLTSKIKE